MKYNEFLEKQQQEFNDFSKGKIYYAFGTKDEILEKLQQQNVDASDLINLGNGGFIKKEFKDELDAFLEKQYQEKKAFTLDNVYEVVSYECWNHEIEISLSYLYHDLVYKIVGLTKKEAKEHSYDVSKAIEDYRKEFHELN